jgi:hypothetical protein
MYFDISDCIGFIEARFNHVFPPFTDLYIPSPKEILDRISASPIPTYTTFASDGATVIPTADDLKILSEMETIHSLHQLFSKRHLLLIKIVGQGVVSMSCYG